MKEAHPWIFAVGLVGQLFFSARMIIQWLKSEKAGKSLSPTIFWQLSLWGSIVFMVYGILRRDIAIIFGQCLVYYIYIRNLHFKKRWNLLPVLLQGLILLAPAVTLIYLFSNSPGNLLEILNNRSIPLWLKIWGVLGQAVFTLRFYLQWLESESKKQSILSRRFWLVSTIGSMMILSYAIFRLDPVLFLGQMIGLTVYLRNLRISRKI